MGDHASLTPEQHAKMHKHDHTHDHHNVHSVAARRHHRHDELKAKQHIDEDVIFSALRLFGCWLWLLIFLPKVAICCLVVPCCLLVIYCLVDKSAHCIHTLSPSDLQVLQLFKELDKDHSHYVTISEIQQKVQLIQALLPAEISAMTIIRFLKKVHANTQISHPNEYCRACFRNRFFAHSLLI